MGPGPQKTVSLIQHLHYNINVMQTAALVKRLLSVVVCAALWLTTPGLGAYQALANMGVAPVQVQVPVGGGSAVGVIGSIGLVQETGRVIPGGPGGGSVSLLSGVVPFGSVQPQVGNLQSPFALPATAIQGLNPSVAALRAQAAAYEGGAPLRAGIQAGPSTVRASALQGRSGTGIQSQPSGPQTDAERQAALEGQDLSQSLQPIRGKANRLGRHFAALKAAFGVREDADVSPASVTEVGLQGPVSGSVSLLERAAAVFTVPISAARAGLQRWTRPAAGATVSGESLSKPVPLVLRNTEPKGLSFLIQAARGSFAKVFSVFKARPTASVTGQEPGDPSVGAGSKKWFGLGKVALMFIGSLVVAQVGVEALYAAMPTLVQKTFGDFTAVAQLTIFSSIASIVSRQIGPLVVKRFGLKKAYLGANIASLISYSLMAGLLATGNMALPLMGVFYAVNGFLGGISLTAMESIPPALVGQSPAKLEKFWTWEQTILEIIGITGPIVTGAVVAAYGFLPALAAYPITMAAALGIVFMTLRLPKTEAAAQAPAASAAPRRSFWAKVAHGAKLVWKNPALRYSFIAFSVYSMLNPFLYTIMGPAFGLRLLGEANAQAATSVIGWLTGFYSLGGLLGGFTMMAAQKRTDRRKVGMRKEYEAKNGPISDEDWAKQIAPWENEGLRKSMLTWMLLGTAGLAGIASLAFPLPMLGALVALPGWLSWAGSLTVQALALIPFGIAQVVSMLKLRSFFQSRVPDAKDMPDAMGFLGSASLAISTAGLLALKALFQNVTGFMPFTYIALALLPLAAYYLYLRWKLNRSSKPS